MHFFFIFFHTFSYNFSPDDTETEMLGLLENHVASTQPKISTQESRSTQQYQPSLQSAGSSYSTRKGKNKYFSQQQEENGDELSRALLGGVGLPTDLGSDHSSKKQDVVKMSKPDVPVVVGTKRDSTVKNQGKSVDL